MAISTPAQKPRGEARSTRSTSIGVPGYRWASAASLACRARVHHRPALPVVVSVAPDSVAARVGVEAGDEIVRVNGMVPRDIIEWRMAVDEAEVELEVRRGGLTITIEVDKRAGEPLGAEVSSAVFDRVRTCDNHCEFCFIYQLPPGCVRAST